MIESKKLATLLSAFALLGAFNSFGAESAQSADTDSANEAQAAAEAEAAGADTSAQGAAIVIYSDGSWDTCPAQHAAGRHHRLLQALLDDPFPAPGVPCYRPASVCYRTPRMAVLQRTPPAGALPGCDFKETEKSYEITMEVPGVSGKDLKITVERNTLIVRAQRNEVQEVDEGNYRSTRRSYGSFQRSFSLPEGTDADAIKATCKDGLLTIQIPKSKPADSKPKTIPVES